MKRLSIVMLVAASLNPGVTAYAALDLDGDIYRNAKYGLRLVVPDNWILSRQTGYPSLLAILSAKEGSAQISLATTSPRSSADLKRLVQQNADAMRAIGLQVTRTGQIERFERQLWRIVAALPAGKTQPKQEIRQLYLQTPRGVLILTLTCPAGAIRRFLPDLDYLLESLEIAQPSG